MIIYHFRKIHATILMVCMQNEIWELTADETFTLLETYPALCRLITLESPESTPPLIHLEDI